MKPLHFLSLLPLTPSHLPSHFPLNPHPHHYPLLLTRSTLTVLTLPYALTINSLISVLNTNVNFLRKWIEKQQFKDTRLYEISSPSNEFPSIRWSDQPFTYYQYKKKKLYTFLTHCIWSCEPCSGGQDRADPDAWSQWPSSLEGHVDSQHKSNQAHTNMQLPFIISYGMFTKCSFGSISNTLFKQEILNKWQRAALTEHWAGLPTRYCIRLNTRPVNYKTLSLEEDSWIFITDLWRTYPPSHHSSPSLSCPL